MASPLTDERLAEIERSYLSNDPALDAHPFNIVRDLIAALQEARREVERLGGLVFVPGLWRCAKCDFQLIQGNLSASTGTITARDQPGDKCPSCDSPLWRVTERQAGNDMIDRADKMADRLKAAEAEIEEARQKVAQHDARVTELLQANNAEVERRRTAEAAKAEADHRYRQACDREGDLILEHNAALEEAERLGKLVDQLCGKEPPPAPGAIQSSGYEGAMDIVNRDVSGHALGHAAGPEPILPRDGA